MALCTQAGMKMGANPGEPPINVPARVVTKFQHFSYMWILKKAKNETPTKGNQICGFQRKGDRELEEGGQKVQTSS